MTREYSTLRLHQIRVSHRTTWEVVELALPSGIVGIGEASDSLAIDVLPEIVATMVSDLGSVWPGDLDEALSGGQARATVDAIDGRLEAFAATTDDPKIAHARRVAAGGLMSALADAAAQIEGISLADWLARFAAPSVPAQSQVASLPRPIAMYANINRAPRERVPDEFLRVASEAVTAGFTTIKLAPFDGPVLDGSTLVGTGLQHVAAVRGAVGDQAEILLDLHHKLDRDELASALPELEDLRVGWLEDAVRVTDDDALDWLASSTDLPIAGGERLVDADEIRAVTATGRLAWLLLDIKFVGGPVRFARLVEAVGDAQLSLHDPTGPVATAHSLQATVLQRPPALLEYAYGEPIERATLIDPAEQIVDGTGTRPTGPGLGVSLAEGRWGPATTVGTWQLPA